MGYSNVYVEEEYLGSVPDKLLYKLDQGDESFADSVKEWVYNNGMKRLLDYVAKAEHSESDCVLFLKRLGVPSEVITSLMEHAKTNKWVSDERYARLYSEDALLSLMSPLDVKQKLHQKKISSKIIEKVINEVFKKETVNELLDSLIDKYLKKYSDLSKNKRFEKIATALYRKGFEYSEYEHKVKGKL